MKRSFNGNTNIQKQAAIVNEWKIKVEQLEKQLAEYNTIAAKEG